MASWRNARYGKHAVVLLITCHWRRHDGAVSNLLHHAGERKRRRLRAGHECFASRCCGVSDARHRDILQLHKICLRVAYRQHHFTQHHFYQYLFTQL